MRGIPPGIRRYLGTEATPIDDVRPTLWNTSAPASPDQVVLLEQYKIYVEMADRVSARRSLTNTFFLTLNTAVFAVIGTFWRGLPANASWLLVFPLLAVLIQCGAWFFLIRTYRQLNSAKYAVIGAMEERLPASPYWSAEWKALGEGKDNAKYWPLTHLEQWIPSLFAAAYVGSFIAAMVVGPGT
ncbi:hypothetical protein ACGF5F_32970 [Streptomyces sp. NPDC047821]|uniref:RipA family octameric membrane protein n=1 Tax=Streptomyces sp. NPDC047821 TaxID=3365488 RepID=UPI0037101CF7